MGDDCLSVNCMRMTAVPVVSLLFLLGEDLHLVVPLPRLGLLESDKWKRLVM